LKAGDSVTFSADAATDRLSSVNVATHSGSKRHAVTLSLAFAPLIADTLYPATVQLEVAAENVGRGPAGPNTTVSRHGRGLLCRL
jgi:hypothetical protein